MADDIVVNMNFNLGKDQTVDDIIDRLLPFIHDEMRMPAGMIKDVIEEIERLRALCNDLYHDATCSESFCRLCGEGIREWEARRG